MVPARNLQLLRDAHATPCAAAAAGLGVTTAPPRHMAQEPIDQHHHEPSKPPPPQERQADHHHHDAASGRSSSQAATTTRPRALAGAVAGTAALGLPPARRRPGVPPCAAGSQLAAFADRAAGLTPPMTMVEALPGMAVTPAAFLRQAAPGSLQASITLPVPRGGSPCLLPPSTSATAPPMSSVIPFGHRACSSGLDEIRVVLPLSAVAAADGICFVLQAASHHFSGFCIWNKSF